MTIAEFDETLSSVYAFRRFFANLYLQGNGIEIGALNHPLEHTTRVAIPQLDQKGSRQTFRFLFSLEGAHMQSKSHILPWSLAIPALPHPPTPE